MNILHIRGTKGLLKISVNDEVEFDKVMEALEKKNKSATSFFNGAVVAFIWGTRKLDINSKKVLKKFLNEHNILWESEHDEFGKKKKKKITHESVNEFTDTIYINKNVRAGSRIEHKGHIIVVGNVHAGSEIIASGNVFVWGVLRGIIHAGFTGARDASIAALILNPTQLRIADQVAINPEQKFRESLSLKPEMAKIKGDDITVESWTYKKEARDK